MVDFKYSYNGVKDDPVVTDCEREWLLRYSEVFSKEIPEFERKDDRREKQEGKDNNPEKPQPVEEDPVEPEQENQGEEAGDVPTLFGVPLE